MIPLPFDPVAAVAFPAVAGPFLLGLMVKSVVILALTAGLVLASFRASAAWRHMVWTAGVTATLALVLSVPALDRAGTAWRVPLPFGLQTPGSNREDRSLGVPIRPSQAGVENPDPVTPAGPSRGSSGESEPSTEPWYGTAPTRRASVAFVWGWTAGTLFLMARLAIGFFLLSRARRRISPLVNTAWLRTRDELCAQYGITRPPPLYSSESAATSMVWGVWRPTIVLPEESARWPAAQKRMVLIHELAHIRRHDLLWNLTAQLARAFFWMNPLTWIAARRMRVEAELACDDVVLTSGAGHAEYAQLLVYAARRYAARSRRHVAAIGMASGPKLEARIRAVLDPNRVRSLVRGRVAAAMLGASLVTALAVAALEPKGRPGAVTAEPARQAVRTDSRPEMRACEQDRWPARLEPDPAATRAAIAMLRNGTGTDRAEAADRLGTVGTPEAVSVLIEALDDGDKHLRSEAATSLGHLGDRRALDPLLEALEDPNKHVRHAAVGALGALGDAGATLPLSALLLRGPEAQIRQSAASALGDVGDRRAVGPLIVALADRDEHVRQSSALSLGRLGAPQASDPLSSLLDDENAHVRAAAVRALGQIGAGEHAPRLAALYDSGTSPFEMLEAARALGQLGDFRGVGLLVRTLRDSPEQFVRRDAAWGIAAVAGTSEAHRRRLARHRNVEAALRDALRDRSLYVRHAAGCALEKLAGFPPD